jgi:PAS domain S-box-containing protein
LHLSLFDTLKIEQSTDCISAYDAELRILIWNRACEEKYGISKQDAIDHYLLQLFPHIEHDYRVACLRTCLREGQTFFFPNLPFLYGSGVYSQAIVPLHNEGREVIGTLNIVRDGEYPHIQKDHLLQPLKTTKRQLVAHR